MALRPAHPVAVYVVTAALVGVPRLAGAAPAGPTPDATAPGQPAAVAGPPRAPAEGWPTRRQVFWAITGALSVITGGLALGLWLRERRSRRAPVAPLPAPPRAAAAFVPSTEPLVCPTCREDYLPPARFCSLDGNRLVPVEAGETGRPTLGGICPTCGKGFDPGVTECPEHDEELLVAPAYFALHPTEELEEWKLCPRCTARQPGGACFCTRDGSALVSLN